MDRVRRIGERIGRERDFAESACHELLDTNTHRPKIVAAASESWGVIRWEGWSRLV